MHMVIFDEMNLSQVEYWFSPFISILEKEAGERFLKLYDPILGEGVESKNHYPAKVKINENVIFVGTVNVDETTKNFSDRLLDRTFVINLKKIDFKDVYNHLKESSSGGFDQTSICRDASVFLSWDRKRSISYLSAFDDHQEEITFLDEFSELLASTMSGNGISHRVFKNIGNYLLNIPKDENGSVIERSEAFDIILNQTVMQKIRGTEAQLAGLIGINGDSLSQPDESELMRLLNRYTAISEFKNVKKTIYKKAEELRVNGYTN